MQVATTGDRKGGGVDQLAVEGLIAKYTFGWSGESCKCFVWRARSKSMFLGKALCHDAGLLQVSFLSSQRNLPDVMQATAQALWTSLRPTRCKPGTCHWEQVRTFWNLQSRILNDPAQHPSFRTLTQMPSAVNSTHRHKTLLQSIYQTYHAGE